MSKKKTVEAQFGILLDMQVYAKVCAIWPLKFEKTC